MTDTVTGFVVPATGEAHEYDPTNPGDLEAWFGPFAHGEHFRKVILASCREAVRADYTLRQEKVSEARLDDLARTHERYIDWLVYTLNGRRLREQNVLASLVR
jgi:hypothetical protein